jgi:hypothetical protein
VINFLRQTRSERKEYLAFFYCDLRRHETQVPLNVVGSIIAQLCSQLSTIPDALDLAFDQSTKVSGQATRPDLALLEAILVSLGTASDILLVIDALDECNKREDILSVLVNVGRKSPRTKVLVTSRNELDICKALSCFPRIHLEHRWRDVSEDINIYVKNRLDSDIKLKWLKDSIKIDIEQTLTARAKGMSVKRFVFKCFLW